MKAPVLYRIAAVLLVLFAAGHTVGFRQIDPRWGIDAALGALRSTHFDIQGLSRTYWDFYTGLGLFVTVFLLFAAALSWQLGGLSQETLKSVRGATWSFAACFVAVSFLSWRYFFVVPLAFSGLITVCLLVASWLVARS